MFTIKKSEDIIKIIKAVNIVEDESDMPDFLNNMSKPDGIKVVSFVNAHAINMCYASEVFSKNLLSSNIILRDGVGMKLLYKHLGLNQGLNMNGTDLIPKILNYNKEKRVALLGTQEPYLHNAFDKLLEDGYKIVVYKDGFKSNEFYLEIIQAYQPDLIILGMGMPRQELLSSYLKEHLNGNVIILNGGAIIDFIGGKTKRAPVAMQKQGMEWLYRLLLEPRRMFNRYVIGNFVFLYRFKKLKLRFRAT